MMGEIKMGVLAEAVAALEAWGKWQRQGEGKDRSPGLEGKFRSNRCPDCYDKNGPCDACKYQKVGAEQLDMRLVMAVERAIGYGSMTRSLGGGRCRVTNGLSLSERDILLNHYRGKKDEAGTYRFPDLRFRRDRMGIHQDAYEGVVANLTLQVWNRAKRHLRA